MEPYGQQLTPVPTEALLQLLEEHAHDVDQLAELPDGVNGVTFYYWNRKPTVKIDARLTQQHWRESRRRSTLTHQSSPPIQQAPLGGELCPEKPGHGAARQTFRGELNHVFPHPKEQVDER